MKERVRRDGSEQTFSDYAGSDGLWFLFGVAAPIVAVPVFAVCKTFGFLNKFQKAYREAGRKPPRLVHYPLLDSQTESQIDDFYYALLRRTDLHGHYMLSDLRRLCRKRNSELGRAVSPEDRKKIIVGHLLLSFILTVDKEIVAPIAIRCFK